MLPSDQNSNHSLVKPDGIELNKIISDEIRDLINTVNASVFSICIGLFGIVTNTINCVVFVQLGFKDSINISLFSLSVSDLGVVLTYTYMAVANHPAFSHPERMLVVSLVHMSTAGWTQIILTKVSGVITVYISMERCLCVVMPLKVREMITPKVTTITLVVLSCFTIGLLAPVYFIVTFTWTKNQLNRTILGVRLNGNGVFLESLTHQFSLALQVATQTLAPIFTVILIRGLKEQNQLRSTLVAQGTSQTKPNEPASLSPKDRRMVRLVIFVTSLLIVLTLPNTAMILMCKNIPEFSANGLYKNIFYVGWGIAYLFGAVNSGINIFVYHRMSTSFRNKFNELFQRCRPSSEKTA